MYYSKLLILATRVQYLNRWIIFLVDLLFSVCSTLVAIAIVSYLLKWNFSANAYAAIVLASIISSIAGFLTWKTYKGIIRHSSFMETGRLAMASLLKVMLMIGFSYLLVNDFSLRTFVLGGIVDCFLTFVLLVIVRVLMIIVYSALLENVAPKRDRLLIYGQDVSALFNQGPFVEKVKFRIEGFLRFGKKESLRIGKYKVYSIENQSEFDQLIEQYGIKAILFTDYKIVKEEAERLVRYCEKRKIRMLVLPAIDELKNGKKQIRALPEVRIEDLLGREEIKINMDDIQASLSGKVILVTGAAGSIGSELCRQLARIGVSKLLLFDSAETPLHNVRLEFEKSFPQLDFVPIIGDVRIEQRLRMVFEQYHPQVIFHAAAYKHVPLMEENPCEAVLVNVTGTRQVADMAVKYNAEKMIMISTDKAVNPTNVMGASKRLAEVYVQSLSCAIKEGKIKGKTKFITTRFGNVLGSNGSVIPRFREQIANGGPVTVTHPDIIRFFMTIPEACRLVLEASTMGEGNEIFVFEMGKPVKIVDLATRMIELAGYRPGEDIQIEFTGLRPGEKLYEEVLSSEENTLPTPNKKIMIAKVRRYDYFEILDTYAEFERLSRNVEIIPTVSLMKQMVPEFISKNSRFEKLDSATASA